jgi:hypothetical protein
MSPVLDRDAFVGAREPADLGASIPAEQVRQTTLLVAILAELQSWRPQAPTAECSHPETHRRELSAMGDRQVQCGLCGADLVRKERS